MLQHNSYLNVAYRSNQATTDLVLPGHGREGEQECSAQEKVLLREEFLSQMHQRFLDGRDKDFNYRQAFASLMQNQF